MGTEHTVALFIANDLDHATGITFGFGATTGGKRKAAHLIINTFAFQLLFGLADPRHLRVGVNDIRHDIVVHRTMLASDAFGGHYTFFGSLVGEHRATHNVTNGIHPRHIGLAKFVDMKQATLILFDIRLISANIIGVGATTNSNNQLVENFLVLTILVTEANIDLAAFDRTAGYSGSKSNVESLFFESTLRLTGNGLVDHRQECILRLKQDHLGPQSTPDTAKLEADYTSADYANPFGD